MKSPLVDVFLLPVALLLRAVTASGGLLVPLYVWPTIAANSEGGYDCVNPHVRITQMSFTHEKVFYHCFLTHRFFSCPRSTTRLPPDRRRVGRLPLSIPKMVPSTVVTLGKALVRHAHLVHMYLKRHGVQAIGYIQPKTGYPNIDGYRVTADVLTDIDLWKSDFDVDGIFVDEVTNRWPNSAYDSEAIAVDYYNMIADYIMDAGGFYRIVLNPGGPFRYEYEGLMEPYYGNPRLVAVVFDNTQWSFQRDDFSISWVECPSEAYKCSRRLSEKRHGKKSPSKLSNNPSGRCSPPVRQRGPKSSRPMRPKLTNTSKRYLRTGPVGTVSSVSKILKAYLGNVADNPTEPKYRSINMDQYVCLVVWNQS